MFKAAKVKLVFALLVSKDDRGFNFSASASTMQIAPHCPLHSLHLGCWVHQDRADEILSRELDVAVDQGAK